MDKYKSDGQVTLESRLTLLMESQSVVVLRAPSHLLMLVARIGSNKGAGILMGSEVRLRFSVEFIAILDRYELSFWTLLEGAPGELLLLPGMLLDIGPRNERWLEILQESILNELPESSPIASAKRRCEFSYIIGIGSRMSSGARERRREQSGRRREGRKSCIKTRWQGRGRLAIKSSSPRRPWRGSFIIDMHQELESEGLDMVQAGWG